MTGRVLIPTVGIERKEGMNCSEARHALWPPERPRLAEGEVLEAHRHVRECSTCESYFAQDRVLLEAYDSAKQERAPRILRERVFDALARERARSLGLFPGERPAEGRVQRYGVLAVVISIAGILAGGFAVTLRSVPEDLNDGGLFAEDYVRRAVAEERITSSDAAEVSRFLTRELGRPIRPLQLAGLRLTSAEICLIEGRRGAMIRYVRDGTEISHYLIPREGARQRDPEASSAWRSGGAGGPALVTWASSEIEQALVGEIPEDHLMELARSALP